MHGESLEGNLQGDSLDGDVLFYLPPGYTTNLSRHDPVVYFLNGYTANAETAVPGAGGV